MTRQGSEGAVQAARDWVDTWLGSFGVVPSNAYAREQELAALLDQFAAERVLEEAKVWHVKMCMAAMDGMTDADWAILRHAARIRLAELEKQASGS